MKTENGKSKILQMIAQAMGFKGLTIKSVQKIESIFERKLFAKKARVNQIIDKSTSTGHATN